MVEVEAQKALSNSISTFHCCSNETCERMREEKDDLTWCSEAWNFCKTDVD